MISRLPSARLLALSLGLSLLLAGEARAQERPVPGTAEAPEPEKAARVDVVPPAGDQAIAERLQEIFGNVEALTDVEVRVRSGVVRLEGRAATEEARTNAVELAESLEGVVWVENRIERPQADEQIAPAVQRLQEWWETVYNKLPLLGIALAVVIAAWFVARFLREWDPVSRSGRGRPLVRGIVRQVVATVIFIGGVIVALELLEATALVGAVVGAAGLAGLAVGFAFRDIAENYLASVLLGARRPFALADHVVIDTHEGKVMRLTTRETVLMTLDGNHLRLPNALVYKAVILNYTRNPLRQLWFDVGVGLGCSLADAQRTAIAALLDTPGVVEEPRPYTRVEELAESNVRVRFFAWVDQREADWYKVKSEAVRRVKSAFDVGGIEMPVPTFRIESTTIDDGKAAKREQSTAEAQRELSMPPQEVRVDDVLERQMKAGLDETPEEENLLR